MNYQPASDDKLRENGFDPKWIMECDPQDGPYRVVRVFDTFCPCCGGEASAHEVMNIQTATSVGQTWHGDNGECDATEHAGALNAAWREGVRAAQAPVPA